MRLSNGVVTMNNEGRAEWVSGTLGVSLDPSPDEASHHDLNRTGSREERSGYSHVHKARYHSRPLDPL